MQSWEEWLERRETDFKTVVAYCAYNFVNPVTKRSAASKPQPSGFEGYKEDWLVVTKR